MSRQALLAVVLLLTGCGSAGTITTTAGTPAPVLAPATPDASSPPDGSGVTPPSLGTYGAKLSERTVAAARAPSRLTIPSIGVDDAVGGVGVAADGQLAVPASPGSLSWYRFGPSPGDVGSAVIAGHVDFAGSKGVFWRLEELKPGSRIEVGYDDGTVRGFTVLSRQQYAKRILPVAELFERSGPARLTLITCGGSFDRRARSYRDNLVVTAVPA